MTEPKSYRLRPPTTATEERRVKVGLYLLPSLYQRVKAVAAERNEAIYETVEDALTDLLAGVVPHG